MSERDRELIVRAARNNAEWCGLVCRTHGCASSIDGAIWVAHENTPPFYPDLVTLEGAHRIADHHARAGELLVRKQGRAVAIKDSFDTLDGAALGCRVLLGGQWIVCDGSSSRGLAANPCRPIEDELGLAAWEQAWSGGSEDRRIFLPALLHEADVVVLAIWQGDSIVAGGIALRAARVVGLSNVFARQSGLGEWALLLAGAAKYFGDDGLIVGYQHGDALTGALASGWRPIGNMKVWLKT